MSETTRKKLPILIKGAGAFYHSGDPERGVLLLHGFTGSPAEMRYLGNRLVREGYTVFIPRYPGHGTSLHEMAGTDFRHYFISAREAYIELADKCSEISIVGLSMGGILALGIAKEMPVAKLVLLSTPSNIKEWSILLAPIAGIFKEIVWIEDERRGINDPGVREHHICYHRGIPVKQSWQLYRAIKKTMRLLPGIRTDVLLMQSVHDTKIPAGSIDYIYNRIGSYVKKRVLLEASDHTITVDYDRDRVAAEVLAFLKTP